MSLNDGSKNRELELEIARLSGEVGRVADRVPMMFLGSMGPALDLVSGVLSVLGDLSRQVDALAAEIEGLKNGDG